MISEKVYGYESTNISLLWMPPAASGKVDNYNVRLVLMDRKHQIFKVNRAIIHATVPYNQDITASITAENCFGESRELNFTFTVCKQSNEYNYIVRMINIMITLCMNRWMLYPSYSIKC